VNISIITPVYKGNKYLNKYLENISKASAKITEIEVIWINDSPEIKIEYNKELIKNFTLKIIENHENLGIHKSRCVGLKEAKGRYILFLDQDDEITEDALITQYTLIEQKKCEMILGNGIYESVKNDNKIFENKFSQKFATQKKPYIMARNFIISPGQCLIKKDSIPQYWVKNAQKFNGADDYLLWLLMLNNNIKMCCNYDVVYIHKYTGENYSLNLDKMYKSQLELVKLLENNDKYNKKDLRLLKRTIKYKHNYKHNFIKETLKNLDIFVYNLYYRIVWKGYILKK